MKFSTFRQKLDRAAVLYRDQGFAVVATRLRRRFDRAIGHTDPAYLEWTRNKVSADAAFDAEHGTQTGGIQEISSLSVVGENARHGVSHIATEPCYFAAMMRDLDFDLNDFTFIDLGSGKGRALVLASEFPFRRLIGVEFSPELHEAAIQNFNVLAARGSDVSRVELICGDAMAYSFPVAPLVIYMFNPFGSSVMRLVARNTFESWRNAPRAVHLLYMNPVHLTDFTDAGWQLVNHIDGGYAHLVPC